MKKRWLSVVVAGVIGISSLQADSSEWSTKKGISQTDPINKIVTGEKTIDYSVNTNALSNKPAANYFSIEAGTVSQSGPGFIVYDDYYGNEVTESLSVSGKGYSVGLNYNSNERLMFYIRHKSLTHSFEDDYGCKIDDIDLTETTIGYLGVSNRTETLAFTYGVFLGLGSIDSYGESISFFTYGPEFGFKIRMNDTFEFYNHITWQERKYSKNEYGSHFDNFPFGAEFGLKINFR